MALCVLLVSLLWVVPPVSRAQGDPSASTTPSIESTPNAGAVLSEANRVLDEARSTMDTVGFVLSFFEVAGVVIGVLLAAGTFAGFRTIQEYRGELNRARIELKELSEVLKKDTDTAKETLRATEERINQSLDEIKRRGDDAIRAIALMELGAGQMKERNLAAAQRAFEQAYALDPDNQAINYYLGELFIQQRNLEKAIEYLDRSGTEYPPTEAAMAYALRLIGERQTDPVVRNQYFAEAERHFIHALQIDGQVRDANNESVWGVLGGLYRRQGRIDDAIRSYQRAEEITPESSYPVVNLALLHSLKGDRERAMHYFKIVSARSMRILDGNPFDYWARFNVITAQIAMGEWDAALKNLDVLMINPPEKGPMESLMEGLRIAGHMTNDKARLEGVIRRVEAVMEAPNA